MPEMGWTGNMLYAGHPRLGIDAEDLNGQLGSYFGAPEGEGILVRSVNSGSAAEKAGVKAGDVITSLERRTHPFRGRLAAEAFFASRTTRIRTARTGR